MAATAVEGVDRVLAPRLAIETANAIRMALEMPREERVERMRLMRRTVKESNVYRWAGKMLMDTQRVRQRQRLLAVSRREMR